MKKKEWVYISIIGLVFILLVIGQYNKKEPVSWKMTLANNDKQPFGTFASFELFKEMFTQDISVSRLPVYNQLKENFTTGGSYIFIQPRFNVDKLDLEKLLAFAGEGNRVFIAAEFFSRELMDTLKVTHSQIDINVMLKDSTGEVKNVSSMAAPKEKLVLAVNEEDVFSMSKNYSQTYFSSFDLVTTTTLGYAQLRENTADFIRVQYGKGFFYLNANPAAFTNYYVLNRNTNKYAFTALSYLPAHLPVTWDEYQKQGRIGEQHVLRELLTYPALKWAYYLALTGIVLFIIFEGKRRQRIIPVFKPLPNQTVDFVKVVGSLYYNKRNNTDIALKRITYLLEYIRTRFYESTDTLNKEFVDRMTEKTGCKKEFIQELVVTINKIKAQPPGTDWIGNNDLVKLNVLIEEFYDRAKNG